MFGVWLAVGEGIEMRTLVICILLGFCLLGAAPGTVHSQAPDLASGFLSGPRHVNLDFDIGYAGYFRKGLVFSATGGPLSVDPLIGLAEEMAFQGLWLSAGATVKLNDRLGAAAKGSWLVPGNKQSSDTLEIPTLIGRDYKTRIQWYTLEGMGMFTCLRGVHALGGFRYDSFYTQLRFPTRPIPEFYGSGDEGNLEVRSYLPYAGLMVGCSNMNVGFIGLPALIGNVKYGSTIGRPGAGVGAYAREESSFNFRRGYFLELFAQYLLPLNGAGPLSGQVGFFAKYTQIHGWAVSDVSLGRGPFAVFSPPYSNEFGITVHRENYVIGGTFNVAFSSPI